MNIEAVLIALGALAIVLGVLVFVHELGHFVAAKIAGIYVHRFSLGMGSPVRWLTTRRGETEYSISWLPLGGYVKMASSAEDSASSMLEGGQAATPVPPGRVFEAKPVWVRMIVILAGVTMNVLFAWGAYTYLAARHGEEILLTTRVGQIVPGVLPPEAQAVEHLQPGQRITAVNGTPVANWNEVVDGLLNAPGDSLAISLEGRAPLILPIPAVAVDSRMRIRLAVQPFIPAVVGQVLPNSAAAAAGIEVGDSIVKIGGQPITEWYDLVDQIEPGAGQAIPVELVRQGRPLSLVVTPRAEPGPDGKDVGKIGVGVRREVRHRSYSLGEAFGVGFDSTVAASTQLLRGIRGMIGGQVSRRSLGGPILIGQLAGQSIQLGLDVFLSFMALISVNLAVLNLLPIPVLDGGQFLFLLAEAAIRRPLSLRLRERLTAVGLVVIVLLMVFVFSNDILRLFGI